MPKKGNSLERLVEAIEKNIIDNPNTEIFRNHKIDGREIDVLVKTVVNGENICIAFECKDYSYGKGHKVSIKEIDEAIGKYIDLPSINKVIIVSTTGFSKNAIESANKHGIGMHTLQEISDDCSSIFIEAVKLIPRFSIRLSNVWCNDTKIILKPNYVIYDSSGKITSIQKIINEIFSQKYIASIAKKYADNNYSPYYIRKKYNLPENYYVTQQPDNNLIRITDISLFSWIWFTRRTGVITNNHIIVNSENTNKSYIHRIKFGDEKLVFVKSKSKSNLYSNLNNELIQHEQL